MPSGHPDPQAWEGDMYSHDGRDLFVIDGHMHFWDANPENWRNKYGESWIKCFHAFHSGLSPAEEVWPFDKFCRFWGSGAGRGLVPHRLCRHGDPQLDIPL